MKFFTLVASSLFLLGSQVTGQRNTPVTGATNGVYPRRSLRTWQKHDPDGFNICIQAWQGIMNVTETDPYSWYEIAGIHGAPFKSWGEPNPSDPPAIGYCSHASGLFPTWHRLYVALLEQRLLVHARQIASRFTGPDSRRYRDAGERCRIAYWDWSETDVLPPVITTPRITVTTPDGPNEIANPFYNYRFSSDRWKEDFTGPFARIPNTARQPNRNSGVSHHDRVQAAMSAGFSARRQNTYNLFSVDNFNAATNRAFRSNSTPGNLVSVEAIHDEVHTSVGGQYGHMAFLEYSGFDPVFWLHHSNVDRIIAMYQAVHPGRGVEPQAATMNFANPMPKPGEEEDDLTPLRPFYDRNGRFYTSRDMVSATSIFDFGYSYPEIPVRFRGRPDEELQAFTSSRINALYGPGSRPLRGSRSLEKRQVSNSRPSRTYICSIVYDMEELSPTAQIHFFFGGIPDANTTDLSTASNLVGSSSWLNMASMKGHMGAKVCKSSVPLNDALLAAGVNIDDEEEAEKFLQENLNWIVVDGHNVVPNVKILEIGVSSAETKYPGGIAEYGDWVTHLDVTDGKKYGLQATPGGNSATYAMSTHASFKGYGRNGLTTAKPSSSIERPVKDLRGQQQGHMGPHQQHQQHGSRDERINEDKQSHHYRTHDTHPDSSPFQSAARRHCDYDPHLHEGNPNRKVETYSRPVARRPYYIIDVTVDEHDPEKVNVDYHDFQDLSEFYEPEDYDYVSNSDRHDCHCPSHCECPSPCRCGETLANEGLSKEDVEYLMSEGWLSGDGSSEHVPEKEHKHNTQLKEHEQHNQHKQHENAAGHAKCMCGDGCKCHLVKKKSDKGKCKCGHGCKCHLAGDHECAEENGIVEFEHDGIAMEREAPVEKMHSKE